MLDKYKGRAAGIVPKFFSLSRYNVELLMEMVPSQNRQGRFIDELIATEYARREERKRLKAQQNGSEGSDATD